MRKYLFLPLLLTLYACEKDIAPEIDDVSYKIDTNRVTLSGLSSGAYMAGQLHVAHSGLFSGAAMLAGGPYYCAEGAITKGIGPCVKGGDLGEDRLLAYAREMESAGKIDALSNLADDSIWLFHGALDDTVGEAVTSATAAFYRQQLSVESLTYVTDVEIVHGFPTISSGMPCATFGTPFLNACDYDAAGELLTALYGPLNARTEASGELRIIEQPGGDDAEMLEQAFLYVPATCAAGESCGVHVAVHGCVQSSEFVGDQFAAGAGFNEWAEANKLLVLYPQVASSKLAPMNPFGCWDWWGYTNEDYATREGPQIKVIKAMLDALAGTTL